MSKHLAPPALSLPPWQEVDVEVRRVSGREHGVGPQACGAPLDQGILTGAALSWVVLTQRRKPTSSHHRS